MSTGVLPDEIRDWRLLFERHPSAMWVACRGTGRILAANDAAARRYGFLPTEFLDLTTTDLVVPAEAGQVEAADTDRGPARVERHRTRSGDVIAVRVTSSPVVFAGHEAEVFVIEAEANRGDLPQAEPQAERLSVLGRVAADVAHDFNNILMAILGFTDLVAGSLDESARQVSWLAQIEKAAQRASRLTRRLLAFGRPTGAEPRVVCLNDVVEDMVPMVRRLLAGRARLVLRLDATLGRVEVDPGRIEQVLMNLAVNGRDAMDEGGTLTVETANLVSADGPPRVRLTVRDTGSGMTDETRQRLFEPFFTTKGDGRGTGLGLPIVQDIVAGYGGEVVVESAVGEGSAFHVHLPQAAPRSVGEDAGDASGARLVGGTELVLVVDEDEVVRALLKDALGGLGYVVLTAATSQQAVEVAENSSRRVDLLLAELSPSSDGSLLAAWFHTLDPGVRVVYSRSGSDEPPGTDGIPVGQVSVVTKPFGLETLAATVRELLDRPVGPVTAA
jgi:two-component system, cell cycle sensor histidine kinase and response regulator CckA